MNIKDKVEKHDNTVLLILLLVNFVSRLVIYFNTTLFRFNDWGNYLDAIEKINIGEKIPLCNGMVSYTISYIGYFFKYKLGNFDLFFIFNCLLGTLTIFVIYKIMVSLNVSKFSSIIAVVLLLLYTEFTSFSSIFYTPIIMVFLLSLTILFTIKFIKNKKFSFYYGILIIITISVSMFFKIEQKYLFVIYFIVGIFYIKNNYKFAIKLIILSFVLFGTIKIIESEVIYKNYTSKTKPSIIFFPGHTWFGGEGGKVTITYPEKQKQYDESYKEYCEQNNIINPTSKDEKKFREEFVKNFIINKPFSWIHLQYHKFFWEYGVLPEANSFKILMTGLTKKHTILTALIVVFPIILYILLFIITFDTKRLIYAIKKRPEIQFMGILFLYYIIATVFYFGYSERYRIPVMVCFWIPLLAYNLTKFKLKLLLQRKKELIIKILVILLFLGNWSYEAYIIGIKNKDRYFKVIEATKEFEKGQTFEFDILENEDK